jgi:hypothetical protein
MFISINKKISDAGEEIEELFTDWYHFQDDNPNPWADNELVAYAKAYGIILVTQESYNPTAYEKNYKIVTVCEKLGAYCNTKYYHSKESNLNTSFQCIDFVELSKREKLYKS